MFPESDHSAAKTWTIALTVVGAWILGGIYLWRHPVPVTVVAVVQVPPGTDLETLCSQSDIVQTTREKLVESNPDGVEARDSAVDGNELRDNLSIRKANDGTWRLTQQAFNEARGVRELTALVNTLERHFAPSGDEKPSNERQRQEDHLRELTAKQAALRNTNRGGNIDEVDGDDGVIPAGFEESDSDTERIVSDPAGIRERINTLQRAMTEARVERLRTEEEVQLVEIQFSAGRRLESIANQLSAGPIQDAVRQIDKQARLSSELKQLNATLANDAEVYGDKHPRLIELRRRFDRLLQEVGGWEHLMAESALNEHLSLSLNQALDLRCEREDNLRLQLELEQSELQDQAQMVQTQTRQTDVLKKLSAEISTTQKALTDLDQPVAAGFVLVQPPSKSTDQASLWRRGWPWLALLAAGVALGWGVNALPYWERSQDYAVFDGVPLLTVPRITFPLPAALNHSAPEAPSNPHEVAQRTGVRQTRWQQTYT